MPAATHSGAISFGLVYIPVKLYSATSEYGVSFNQLHKQSLSRIRYRKVREDTGEEVKPEDIVRGYQYEKGQYVVLSDEELEQMKSQKDKAISIAQFVEKGSIDAIFFEKAYYVVPDGSNKAFMLLKEAMQRQNVMAVATTVLGTKDTVITLSPAEQGLIAQTLYYLEEIKAMPMPAPIGVTEISDAEMNMATKLIQIMQGAYDPSIYHDAYEAKLREAIQSKIEGKGIVQPQQLQSNVIDLMEALQRSLEQKREFVPPQPKTPMFGHMQ